MLENSNLICGKEGQELEKLFKEYNDLTIKLKDLTETKGKITDRIKTLCPKADTYETINYTIKMAFRKGSVTVDRKKLEEEYPEVFKKVTKVGNDTLQMGTPKLKGDRS